jgi:transcriptional regulator with XRE-family HTH domain
MRGAIVPPMSDSDHEDQLSKNLKALRAARGWNQTQTALAAKVAQTAVSRVERGEGRRDAGKVLSRLAQTFGVTLEQLTGAVPLPMEVVMATPDGLQVRTVNYVRPAHLPTNAIVSTPEGDEGDAGDHAAARGAHVCDRHDGDAAPPEDQRGGVHRRRLRRCPGGCSARRTRWCPTGSPPSRVVEAVLQTARALRERGLPVSTTSVLAGLAYSLLDGTATESSRDHRRAVAAVAARRRRARLKAGGTGP